MIRRVWEAFWGGELEPEADRQMARRLWLMLFLLALMVGSATIGLAYQNARHAAEDRDRATESRSLLCPYLLNDAHVHTSEGEVADSPSALVLAKYFGCRLEAGN